MRAECETDAEPASGAFADMYGRHFADIHRYIAGRLGRAVADDIAADTFVIALRKRDGLADGRGPTRAWLYGIATNLIAQHRRQEVRRYRALRRAGASALGERYHDGCEDRVVSMVVANGMRPRLARTLACLSPEERDVLLLVALADLSHEEIAQALGVPYGTVGSRLNRARRKVRAALEEEGQIGE